MKKAKPFILLGLLILSLVFLDQLIKGIIPKEEIIVIPNVLKLTYSQNTGGAFSLGSGNVTYIIVINILILAFAIRFLTTHIKRTDKGTIFSLCLIIAGGISNLINRIFLGYVIDYINVEDFIKFPIFNLADIYIVIRMDCISYSNNKIFNKNKEIRRKYERFNYNFGCAD